MKQTAVNWLLKQYIELGTLSKSIVEQAKAMEKEQIIDAYKADCDTLGHTNSFNVAAEQYYKKTFKSK